MSLYGNMHPLRVYGTNVYLLKSYHLMESFCYCTGYFSYNSMQIMITHKDMGSF